MNGQYIEVDISEFKDFTEKLRKLADGDFHKKLADFLDAQGFEFLRIIEEEIIRLKVVDTRLLLISFHKGAAENIYELDEGDLTLTVGTNVEYAGWVNDGHKQTPGRFIPGTWTADGKFRYDPNADSGMVLKANYVEGRHFMETAVRAMEKIFPKTVERMLDEWLQSYFS